MIAVIFVPNCWILMVQTASKWCFWLYMNLGIFPEPKGPAAGEQNHSHAELRQQELRKDFGTGPALGLKQEGLWWGSSLERWKWRMPPSHSYYPQCHQPHCRTVLLQVIRGQPEPCQQARPPAGPHAPGDERLRTSPAGLLQPRSRFQQLRTEAPLFWLVNWEHWSNSHEETLPMKPPSLGSLKGERILERNPRFKSKTKTIPQWGWNLVPMNTAAYNICA